MAQALLPSQAQAQALGTSSSLVGTVHGTQRLEPAHLQGGQLPHEAQEPVAQGSLQH